MNNTQFARAAIVFAAFAAIISLGITDTASAQLNDSLANAEVIFALPFADTVSNVGAGLDSAEVVASCGLDGGKSAWWRYTALASGPIAVSTSGSTFDTILSVYVNDGSGHPLSEFACNDDVDSNVEAGLSIDAVLGVDYFFRVTGFDTESGVVTINVTLPSPDDLDGAKFVFGLPFSDSEGNIGAGPEAGETIASCGADLGNSIWWRFTPWFSGVMIADTDNSNFDTILSVFTGGTHPLAETICDDNGGTVPGRSKVTFPVVDGNIYFFRVTGTFGDAGTVGFALRASPGVSGRNSLRGYSRSEPSVCRHPVQHRSGTVV